MRSIVRISMAVAATLSIGLTLSQTTLADEMNVVDQGREIAFDRKKGNCLACHEIADGELPGNIAPILVAMNQRFPDKAKLRAQIWDSTVQNPSSFMPPFGLHGMLTEDEIDKVTEFIYAQ